MCDLSEIHVFIITDRSDETKASWFRKKPMDLCGYESEDHEHGVGTGVNSTLLSDTI